MPYEELMIALRSGSLRKILNAPLISLNMTSGHLFANMYAFTIGPLIAGVILGILTGLAIVVKLRMHSVGGKAVGILGLGLLATIGASSAGLLGCHGGADTGGGILAVTGMNAATVSILAWLSPYVQVTLILMLGGYYFLLHRKMRQE
jgi:hypothetical protein